MASVDELGEGGAERGELLDLAVDAVEMRRRELPDVAAGALLVGVEGEKGPAFVDGEAEGAGPGEEGEAMGVGLGEGAVAVAATARAMRPMSS